MNRNCHSRIESNYKWENLMRNWMPQAEADAEEKNCENTNQQCDKTQTYTMWH